MKFSLELDAKPMLVFREWWDLAQQHNSFEPTSMTLATVDSQGMPHSRVVLLKKLSPEAFGFFTNYESSKSQQLFANPRAALNFHWEFPHHRQVRVRGLVEKMPFEESQEYFDSRPRGSQIGAWASPQSHLIKDRLSLELKVKEIEDKFRDQQIPCPPFWGGFWLKPLAIEFWQAQEYRLHDRVQFTRHDPFSPWRGERLAP